MFAGTALVTIAAAATAHADPGLELGVVLGGHAFSHTSELGAYDDDADPGPSSTAMFGGRVALPLTHRLAIEGEGMIMPTSDDVLGKDAMVYGLRAQLRCDLLTGRFRPFVIAGAGMLILRSSSTQLMNDVDPAYHWGVGVRYALGEHVDLRIDGRQLIVPDRTLNGATSDYETTVGLTYRFGGAPPPVVVAAVEPPPPPPEPEPEPPPPPPAPPPPPPPPPPVVIEELAGIGFEHDSATIDHKSEPILEHAYELLHAHAQLSVEISGHTSSEGDPERNRVLSLARAEAVKTWLVDHGIAASRIMSVGHGSDDPIADNTTDEGRRKNRRIEFRVIPSAAVDATFGN